MRITFAGMDAPVEVRERGATILRVLNQRLYARVCESLVSQKGEGAVEPYSVWDDDGCEVGPANALLVVANPFDLPWKHRSMVGGLYSSLEAGLLEDEDMRRELQGFRVALESSVHKLGFQLNADYGFAVEWSLGSYLKAFSYEVDLTGASTLLDKLICFADFVADVMVGKVLVFVNLGTFLTENDLLRLNDRLFFTESAHCFWRIAGLGWMQAMCENTWLTGTLLSIYSLEGRNARPPRREDFAPMVLEQWHSDW